MTGGPLLAVDRLRVEFPQRGWRRPPLVAVDDVGFSLDEGMTLALVGESGSGKSTIVRAVLGLVQPTAGTVAFAGRDVTRAGYRERRALARDISVVFQDPYSALDPALTVGTTLREPVMVQGATRRAADESAQEMLRKVGLPADAVDRHPGQFSGGQRQRIAIARALTVTPQLLICDEPVSSLDLSIQAQVLNLLQDLQEDLSLAMLFVSHDLTVVRHVADSTAVLLHGQIMEVGPAAEVHENPRHPYTVALLAAAPVPDPVEQASRRAHRRQAMAGTSEGSNGSGSGGGRDAPSLDGGLRSGGAVRGCPFAPRCPHRMAHCETERPVPTTLTSGVTVACHLFTTSGRQSPEKGESDESRQVTRTRGSAGVEEGRPQDGEGRPAGSDREPGDGTSAAGDRR